jgi:hypothetical protein
VNSVGGVLSSTITTVASSVNSATSSNIYNTIVKRDGSGNFAASTITAGTLSLTTALSVANGGTGATTVLPNYVFVGPASGSSAGAPSFRALTSSDMPTLSVSKTFGNYDNYSANILITDDIIIFTPYYSKNNNNNQLTLPSVSGNIGKTYYLKNFSIYNTFTLKGYSSETIDGSNTQSIEKKGVYGSTIAIYCTGTEWIVISGN